MNDTLIVCLTCLLGLALLVGTGVFLLLTRWRTQREHELELQRNAVKERYGVVELNSRWSEQNEVYMRDLQAVLEQYNTGQEQTSRALLALSERVALFETALKNSIAQMVEVTKFTTDKQQALTAAAVRGTGAAVRVGPVKRPSAT